MKNEKLLDKRDWNEFRESGLLWFANTILHAFGWCIVIEEEDGIVTDAYPARTSFRGFGEASTEKGYIKLSKFMKENADILLREAEGKDESLEELQEEIRKEQEDLVWFKIGNVKGNYPNTDPFIFWMNDPRGPVFLRNSWAKENKICVRANYVDNEVVFYITATRAWVEEKCPKILSVYQEFTREDEDGKELYLGEYDNFAKYKEENFGVTWF